MLSEPHDKMVRVMMHIRRFARDAHNLGLLDHQSADTVQHYIDKADNHLETSVGYHNMGDYQTSLSHMLVSEHHLSTAQDLFASSYPMPSSLDDDRRGNIEDMTDALYSYSWRYLGDK